MYYMSPTPARPPSAPIPLHAPPDWLNWATGGAGAKSPNVEHAFEVRNLLVDESVPDWRAVNYGRYLTGNAITGGIDWKVLPDAAKEWRGRHGRYFEERVVRPAPAGGIPGRIDPSDDTVCPETFQQLPGSSPFLNASLDLDLIRVENLVQVAARAGYLPSVLRDLADRILKGDLSAETDLRDVLDSFSARRDLRPAFAGFYLDVQDIFDSSKPEWADDLRDALGLYHYNPRPPLSEFTVLVFRYPVRSVPHFISDTKVRPLVPPTVLDSLPNPAFCPVPAGSVTGHTVHLNLNVPPLMREVLHPPVAYKPSHLFRMGVIRRPLQVANLEESRRWHLEVVRDQTGRPDFAQSTDP
jgi:hypothetical protein